MPCGHSFHTSCIENQIQADLQWSNLCALCRTDHEEAFSCVPALERIQNNNYERRFDLDHWEPDPEAYEDGAVTGPVDEPAAEPITSFGRSFIGELLLQPTSLKQWAAHTSRSWGILLMPRRQPRS